jgi:hypothetical protein
LAEKSETPKCANTAGFLSKPSLKGNDMDNEMITDFVVSTLISLGGALAMVQTYVWIEMAATLIKRFI